jgi:hypothetical protein
MEAWKVDEHGQFIAVVKGLQTEHGPDPGNIWNCHKCGAQAKVTTD